MTQEALKLSQEALAGLKDVEKQVRELVAENRVLKEALREHAMREVQRLGQEIEQEPVIWGVDWGKAGDIPCVSIIKRVPNGGIEVMAVEYAPYSYTTPPQQEPVRIMGFNCKCGRRMEVSAEQGVVPAPQRTWVGLTDEEIKPCWYEACQTDLELTSQLVVYFAKAIEVKLKEKNNAA